MPPLTTEWRVDNVSVGRRAEDLEKLDVAGSDGRQRNGRFHFFLVTSLDRRCRIGIDVSDGSGDALEALDAPS